MHEKVDLSLHNCLFVWRNQPSVVIGRHQNPWRECHVREVKKNGVNVCRRNSGGGAVYHDLGNLNFTFFTHRKDYNRKHNLNIIVTALKKQWPLLDVEVNKRDDIVLNQKFKISGSSSKLGRNSTFHHCTLLINSNKEHLKKNLAKNSDHMICNATASVRSPVQNLADVDKTICIEEVSNAVVSMYVDHHSPGRIFEISTDDETLTPGIRSIADGLQDWKWIYGKTPDFSVERVYCNNEHGLNFIRMKIRKGFIAELEIVFENSSFAEESKTFSSCLCSVSFDHEQVKSRLDSLRPTSINGYLITEILSLV